MRFYQKEISTPVGVLTLVGSERGLYAVLWESDSESRVRLPQPLEEKNDFQLFLQVEHELSEYFVGQRQNFSIPLDLSYGTAFQQTAWQALQRIPYGEVRSYKQQAEKVGKPKASRAIGTANGKNPLSIIVPCHRVVASNGGLGGFAGGLEIKQKLLDLERQFVKINAATVE